MEELTTLQLIKKLITILKPKRDELRGAYVREEYPKTIGNYIRRTRNDL